MDMAAMLMNKWHYGDLRSQADTNGFILVHPEGLDDIGWN